MTLIYTIMIDYSHVCESLNLPDDRLRGIQTLLEALDDHEIPYTLMTRKVKEKKQ